MSARNENQKNDNDNDEDPNDRTKHKNVNVAVEKNDVDDKVNDNNNDDKNVDESIIKFCDETSLSTNDVSELQMREFQIIARELSYSPCQQALVWIRIQQMKNNKNNKNKNKNKNKDKNNNNNNGCGSTETTTATMATTTAMRTTATTTETTTNTTVNTLGDDSVKNDESNNNSNNNNDNECNENNGSQKRRKNDNDRNTTNTINKNDDHIIDLCDSDDDDEENDNDNKNNTNNSRCSGGKSSTIETERPNRVSSEFQIRNRTQISTSTSEQVNVPHQTNTTNTDTTKTTKRKDKKNVDIDDGGSSSSDDFLVNDDNLDDVDFNFTDDSDTDDDVEVILIDEEDDTSNNEKDSMVRPNNVSSFNSPAAALPVPNFDSITTPITTNVNGKRKRQEGTSTIENDWLEAVAQARNLYRMRVFVDLRTKNDPLGRRPSLWSLKNGMVVGPLRTTIEELPFESDQSTLQDQETFQALKNSPGSSLVTTRYWSAYTTYCGMKQGDVIVMVIPGKSFESVAVFGIIEDSDIHFRTTQQFNKEFGFPVTDTFLEFMPFLLGRKVRWYWKCRVRDLPGQSQSAKGSEHVGWILELAPMFFFDITNKERIREHLTSTQFRQSSTCIFSPTQDDI